ncbi:hypothetical protein V12B01_13680 [Vibrio splendidus 12B01]|nr:hypothetical protein V12B01_13680 [Vibrio splendidus 12B01]
MSRTFIIGISQVIYYVTSTIGCLLPRL